MSCGMRVTIKSPEMHVSTGGVSVRGNVDVQSLTVIENGTYEESGIAYSPVEVNVPTKNAQIINDVGRVSSSTYVVVPNIRLVVEKSGTYNVYWSGYRNSTSGVFGTQLCINGVDHGLPKTSFDETYDIVQNARLENVQLNQGDILTIKARSRTTSYAMYVMGLTIIEV